MTVAISHAKIGKKKDKAEEIPTFIFFVLLDYIRYESFQFVHFSTFHFEIFDVQIEDGTCGDYKTIIQIIDFGRPEFVVGVMDEFRSINAVERFARSPNIFQNHFFKNW